MRTSQAVVSAAVAVASLATASPAVATPVLDPGTFGSVREGSPLVSSSVLFTHNNVEMMGGWTNDRVQVAARNPADVAAAVSLSAERKVAVLTEILPDARRVRVPSFHVGSREDGFTTFGRETRDFHRVTPARVNQMLLVPGGDHGVDLLSDENGPRLRATTVAFLATNG